MTTHLHHAAVALDERGIATVTIRNAGALNILSSPVLLDLIAAFEALAQEPVLRVAILRGTGDRAFVAGADIKEMGALAPETAPAFIDRLRRLCDAVRCLPVPVIARVAGWALGGGLELAAACDLRYASNRAQLGMPEVKIGIPSIIHAALLPRLIGNARANWLLLTGESIAAAQALSWGLIDASLPLDRLDAEIAHLAGSIAGYGPMVMRQQKRLIREWMDAPLPQAIADGVQEFANAFDTGEPQRYMAALARK
ncbi:enoyl-CoA hydratase [Verminephrobacter eiseniae]|uniref:Short chain enoyl-CoA hydratase n=1 Tax=Verminephrobacter eiseniae (strain EF01-2) TaxID=391735 RepID=A1WIF9_VEREI|nr:enoyl-CoA hydratase [Verminephrobacter eiseniae]ABM57416.1 short chain enoyl-CoA hydratase [Verminephrobacter eiseniae EF01-2]MCW5283043.1 enoyl-CoA hydratase [Verminephrobacter eiseniae]MCW5303358.1 enoyl-CoA hydratase [Verminephrobacter eiseniae]MCW8179132.1 enoyl-CoA hydratase [Verminephrobacter eiseniae]MCW8188751.1 enoyl-CoA hydratase [Verminephrobacter eiseniae]